jgi:hypothetical protein
MTAGISRTVHAAREQAIRSQQEETRDLVCMPLQAVLESRGHFGFASQPCLHKVRSELYELTERRSAQGEAQREKGKKRKRGGGKPHLLQDLKRQHGNERLLKTKFTK